VAFIVSSATSSNANGSPARKVRKSRLFRGSFKKYAAEYIERVERGQESVHSSVVAPSPSNCSLERACLQKLCRELYPTPHKCKHAHKRANRNSKIPAYKRFRVVQDPSRHASNNIREAADEIGQQGNNGELRVLRAWDRPHHDGNQSSSLIKILV